MSNPKHKNTSGGETRQDRRPLRRRTRKGVTIIELVVVVLIIAVLSTVAVPVLVGQVTRARVAVTADTIRQLEIAIARYEIDTGEFPPSGTAVGAAQAGYGNSFLMEALLHSSGGNVNSPSSPRWAGPYLEFNEEQLFFDTTSGAPTTRSFQLLDPFESFYTYTRFLDYETLFATRLPASHPFFATETFFNPRTVQIWSSGVNGITSTDINDRGREADDINNF